MTATIRIIDANTFEILCDPSYEIAGYPFYVPDTRNLDSIEAVISQEDWTEDELQAAVERLNADDEREQRTGDGWRRHKHPWASCRACRGFV